MVVLTSASSLWSFTNLVMMPAKEDAGEATAVLNIACCEFRCVQAVLQRLQSYVHLDRDRPPDLSAGTKL